MKEINSVLDKIQFDKFEKELNELKNKSNKRFVDITNSYIFEKIFYKVAINDPNKLCKLDGAILNNPENYPTFYINNSSVSRCYFLALTGSDDYGTLKKSIILCFKFPQLDRHINFEFANPFLAGIFLIKEFKNYINLCNIIGTQYPNKNAYKDAWIETLKDFLKNTKFSYFKMSTSNRESIFNFIPEENSEYAA